MQSSLPDTPRISKTGAGVAERAILQADQKTFLILAGLAALSMAVYVAFSARMFRIGFPLDDAWIHQTYARNLARLGEWSFIPGQPSAGSTAPLWSALLAIGHTLGSGPYLWTYLLGWAGLLAIGIAGMATFRRLQPERAQRAIWAGIFLVFEWHLVWGAASGMETLLAALLILVVCGSLLIKRNNWLITGVLVGLSAWVRPDGITLAGPVLWTLAFDSRPARERFLSAGQFGVGLLLIFLPYLGFNRLLSGAWWPNTYYAKQAEYAVLRELPFWRRLSSEAGLPLIGAGAALLPGFVLQLFYTIRKRNWSGLAAPLWCAGYLLLYAWRLPVIYQHGRYVIPAMPVYFVWALAGMAGWLDLNSQAAWKRITGRSWLLITTLLTLSFWLIGARTYAQDVAIIESEMVDAANWVAANTPPAALIAAHDIGALGYFSHRDLLDMAGLVSPEVISYIRDEPRLAQTLNRHRVNYLVAFPNWYPQLTRHAELIYSTGGQFAPQAGGENMTIYRWGETRGP